MQFTWILVLFSIFVILFFVFARKPTKIQESSLPYVLDNLLTQTEYNFYLVLNKIVVKHNCVICPKVGLKDIAKITAQKDEYMKWFSKISQKHMDFLICNEKLKPICVIELDDKSHNKESAKKNDEFKNLFFETIGLNLVRIKTGKYDNEIIENKIFKQD